MKKSELLEENTPQQESAQEIESQHYVTRSLEESAEISFGQTYEWFENMVIKKETTVDFKKGENGLESATIRLKGSKTNSNNTYYHTISPEEIGRLRAIQEGKIIIVEP